MRCDLANSVETRPNGAFSLSMPLIEATLFCGNTGRGESESTLEGHIYPTVADFDYEFVGGNEFHALCSTCQGDVNGDGIVDVADILIVIGNWGCIQ